MLTLIWAKEGLGLGFGLILTLIKALGLGFVFLTTLYNSTCHQINIFGVCNIESGDMGGIFIVRKMRKKEKVYY